MTTKAQLRKAATSLPEVEEWSYFGMPAFSVRGKRFASLTKRGQVQLRLPADQVDAVLAELENAEPMVRNDATIGLRAPLADVGGKDLNALVRMSWRHCAPKQLRARLDAADVIDDRGDLPPSIGRPATQAMLGAGLTTLEQVATQSESELLAMHGVGPKAVRILRDVLAAQGMSLR